MMLVYRLCTCNNDSVMVGMENRGLLHIAGYVTVVLFSFYLYFYVAISYLSKHTTC